MPNIRNVISKPHLIKSIKQRQRLCSILVYPYETELKQSWT